MADCKTLAGILCLIKTNKAVHPLQFLRMLDVLYAGIDNGILPMDIHMNEAIEGCSIAGITRNDRTDAFAHYALDRLVIEVENIVNAEAV